MKTIKAQFGFKGGVHPQYHKDLAAEQPIERLPLPKTLAISMSQHLGARKATSSPRASSSASATASFPQMSTPLPPAPSRPSSRAWAPSATGSMP